MDDAARAADERAAYAGFWRRFAAYAIDYVIVFAGSAVLGAIAQAAGVVGESARELSVSALVGYFLYCALLESSAWQGTVGKRALGIRVTDRRGTRISFVRAALRFIAKLLSVLTLFLGYLLIVATRRRQALHDLLAGTVVGFDATPRRPAAFVAALSVIGALPIAIALLAIALPAYQDYTLRAQVSEGLNIARIYRDAIETAWRQSRSGFADLTTQSVAPGHAVAGRYVESVEVLSGMVVITYGGAANDALAGSVLTLVPALDAHDTLAWACGYGDPPAGFEPVFDGHAGYTDIDERYLPSACRSTPR